MKIRPVKFRLLTVLSFCLVLRLDAFAQEDTSRGEKMIAEYFRQETARLTKECLAEIQTKADWEKHKETYRQQLREMLGLEPFPERTPLEPVVTKTAADDPLRLRARGAKEGRRQLRQQDDLPAPWSLVRPKRLCLPDD
jgi:hypothetical protein